jgi:hypothetical protein
LQELTFIEERDEALYQAYVNALHQPDVKSHQQAIEVAINSPTSQFWISPIQAYREILWKKKGIRPNHIRPLRHDLVAELYERYKELSLRPTFRGCSTYFISQFSAQSRASKFYLSTRSAVRIINRKRREKRCK